MTDVVALSERYGELLRISRTASTPTEKLAAKLEMIEVEVQLRFSANDFLTGPTENTP